MKIIRNTTGRFEEYADLKSFDFKDVNSDEQGVLVMALHHAMELYQARGWDKERDSEYSASTIKQYKEFESMMAKLTDYKNHERTFNGKKVKK